MTRNTKIICTLGPASREKNVITKMADAGMDIARINFSHGTTSEHRQVIRTIRKANSENGSRIKILQDLEGYRIRIGHLKRPIELKDHHHVWMAFEAHARRGDIPLDLEIDTKALRPGMCVFINDGMVSLKVLRCSGKRIKLQVLQGGILKSKKGVNIPELKLKGNILTEKDKKDIEFGIAQKVDYVAQSFVRNKRDILRIADLVKPHLPGVKIIAKIESKEGIRNLDSIIDACDGILVARGDLGISLPIYQLPVIQKDIIRRCNKKKKLVITATQMLESMTTYSRPTRAEVSDVANAILDGTDFVMLSGETAVGRFPARTVRMMRQIIDYTEKSSLK